VIFSLKAKHAAQKPVSSSLSRLGGSINRTTAQLPSVPPIDIGLLINFGSLHLLFCKFALSAI
jgi:hypothetical protein